MAVTAAMLYAGQQAMNEFVPELFFKKAWSLVVYVVILSLQKPYRLFRWVFCCWWFLSFTINTRKCFLASRIGQGVTMDEMNLGVII